MKPIKLDEKDKKILYELDKNSRQGISSIAKKVRLSKEVVNYRIKNLEKRKIIKGYYAVLQRGWPTTFEKKGKQKGEPMGAVSVL